MELTDIRTDMALIANKTALFAVFKASSRVTKSFLSSMSVSISVDGKKEPITLCLGLTKNLKK